MAVTATDASLLVAAGGFLFTILSTASIVGVMFGALRSRVDALERSRSGLATREDVQRVETQVAEIRGMFTLTLRNPDHE